MVSTLSQPAPANSQLGTKKADVEENVLTPRFYTTDFDKAAHLDLSSQETELKAVLAEMQADYNQRHFIQDQEFKQSWDHIQGEERQAFIDYLERSCVSEFSGFLLFKELSRKLKGRNPLLAEIFHLMSRDEARHAGFINKAMANFNISLDLGKMTHQRAYTYFPVEWVLYTVYLSEKIGYWRYILIHQQLRQHPEHQFYPIFRYFEPWCQDENRHGDIFKALIRSQPQLWKTWQSRLWSRFFLLTVFATHTLTVHERAKFYEMLGLDAAAFDADVIRHTNNTAARAFPSVLDVDHPDFFPRLQKCSANNLKIKAIDQSNQLSIIKLFRKVPLILETLWHLLRIYLTQPIDAELMRGVVH